MLNYYDRLFNAALDVLSGPMTLPKQIAVERGLAEIFLKMVNHSSQHSRSGERLRQASGDSWSASPNYLAFLPIIKSAVIRFDFLFDLSHFPELSQSFHETVSFVDCIQYPV